MIRLVDYLRLLLKDTSLRHRVLVSAEAALEELGITVHSVQLPGEATKAPAHRP